MVRGEPSAPLRAPLADFLRAKTTTLTRILNTSAVEEVAAAYDLKTGALLAPPWKHPDRIRSAEFSPDGARVLTACIDGSARLFDAVSGTLIHEWKHEFPLTRARFSPDGRTVLTTCGGWKRLPRPLTAYDAGTGALRWTAWHEDDVSDARFSPDSTLIASIGLNAQVRLFRAADGSSIGTPLTLRSVPGSVLFSPDSRLLAITGSGDEPNLLDTATAQPAAIPMPHPGGIHDMQFSADSRTLATRSSDGLLHLWPLAAATGSVEELQRTAELLSNQTLEGNSPRRLTVEELRVARRSGSMLNP